MKKDVIIACDFATKSQFDNFIKQFCDIKPFIKIGYQLFYAIGSEIIRDLKEKGFKIFLDLKLHDIPNTVENGIKSLLPLNVDFITIHAAGGIKMMEAAIKATLGTQTKILAVTQLTSTSQEILEKEILIDRKIEDVVHQYTVHALESGVAGVICSVHESLYIKNKISNNLITVCPGVRIDNNHHDQSRVASPKDAQKNKVDFIVIGRPIINATNPLQEYQKYCKAFLGGPNE